MQGNNAKAFYRRALAHEIALRYDEAEADLKHAQQVRYGRARCMEAHGILAWVFVHATPSVATRGFGNQEALAYAVQQIART